MTTLGSSGATELRFESLCLSRRNQTLIKDLSVEVPAGSTMAVMGRSGAGKTTLLRTIAGLSAPASGRVHRSVECVPVVFQEPRLLPWRTVLQNIELVLPENERSSGFDWLTRVGLADVADAFPLTLSGGMKQRVSIARALARQSSIVLVDEPFSHLDVITADQLRRELKQHLAATGRTCIWVTHDPAEAADVAQQTLVMAGSPGAGWTLVTHAEYSTAPQLIAALGASIEHNGHCPGHQEVP